MEKIKRKSGYRYREKIYIDEKEYKSPCFRKRSLAKLWKAKHLSDRDHRLLVKSCVTLSPDGKETATFEEFTDDWLEGKVKIRNSRRTYDRYSGNLRNHLYPLVGRLPLSEIKISHADTLVKLLTDANHKATGINLILGVFKRVMNEAVLQEKIEKSPLATYRKLKVYKTEPKCFSEEDILQFLTANRQDVLYPLYLTCLGTGMRKGEILGLCWSRVDFDKSQIRVTRTRDRYGLHDSTKTIGSNRIIPMAKDVRQTLIELYERKWHQEYVFCTEPNAPVNHNQINSWFKKAQIRAGFKEFNCFHSLRHAFASLYVLKGGSLFELQKLLGHSSIRQTEQYSHMTESHLAQAIQIISFFKGGDKK